MSSSPTSSSSSEPGQASPFDAIGELCCPLTVVLGTSTISVRECLGLARHSVIRLSQSAGEDLRIDVDGVTIANGEVAILDTSVGIRITELAPPPPRSRRL
jgi:flagellar motor switch protein FliN